MALITCSECKSEISDKAATCVKCGAPLRRGRNKPTTIQATGKDAKVINIFSRLLIVVSAVLIFVDSVPNHMALAVGGIIIGVLGVTIGRVMTWWKYR